LTQIGYELHALEGQVSYFISYFLPEVSIFDYLIGDETYIIPENPISSTTDVTARTADGWALENDSEDGSDWIDDEYFAIDGLQTILDLVGSTFDTQSDYLSFDIIGDSSALSL